MTQVRALVRHASLEALPVASLVHQAEMYESEACDPYGGDRARATEAGRIALSLRVIIRRLELADDARTEARVWLREHPRYDADADTGAVEPATDAHVPEREAADD